MDRQKPGYIPTLNGWRAVAILMVLLDHSGDTTLSWARHFSLFASPDRFLALKEFVGLAGVHIFFALSGFLITTNLISEETRRGSVSLKRFYLRRLFRIQPVAITFLVVVAGLAAISLIPVVRLAWIGALAGFANMIPGSTWYTGHFWSLAVEEQFYLLWPAAFILLAPRMRLRTAIFIALADALWRVIALKYQITLTVGFINRLDMQAEWLMWGCIAAIAWRERRSVMPTAMSAWLPLIPIVLMLLSGYVGLTALDWKAQQLLASLAAASSPLLFIGTVKSERIGLGWLLETRVLSWLGRISYSLYLWQQLFTIWADQRDAKMGILQSVPLCFALSVLAATASYYLIEQPFIKIGKRVLSNARSGRVSSAVEAS